MDGDLTQRLLLAENDFLVALQNGPQMLGSFRQKLSALPNALSVATKTGGVSNDTLSLAHSVASRILNIASCYLRVRDEEEYFTAQLCIDYDAMVHQMNALHLSAQPESSPSDGSPDTYSPALRTTTPSETCILFPAFVTSAYQWLLENLHNPYPTAEVKKRIAVASSSQVSSVNSWFINTRRRIGWTSLCRERFSNCRADMIDAAYRALVEEDPRHALSPDLRHSFVAIKVAAENLYPSTFTESSFLGDPDTIIKDMAVKRKESIAAGECRQVEQANLTKTFRDSYPSPARSVATSPVPTLNQSIADESEGEKDISPPIVAGSKRRRSSVEPANQSVIVGRPIKHLRTSIIPQTCLPSPPSSINGIDVPRDDGLLEPFPLYSTQSELKGVLSSCKRRLSVADDSGALKRPRGSMGSPCLFSVSNPLPSPDMENECSIDDWFNTNFDALFAIPPPVDATEPELSSSWEVELFRDYNIPRNPRHTLGCPPTVAANTDILAGSDPSELDGLLRSITGDSLVVSPESVPPSGPYMLSLDPSTPDTSSIDWTSFLNRPDDCQPHIRSRSSQYPADTQTLSEIDLSVLQLPHAIPLFDSQVDSVSNQAKIYQLHVMQEAVRRMERELESEGIIMWGNFILYQPSNCIDYS